MFTGIIEEIGVINKVQKRGGGILLSISASKSFKELKINDSVAINGACQTVISKIKKTFEVEAVEETLKKTTLGFLKAGDHINLELPMRLNERLGGHMVLGHVDSTGQITKIEKCESSWLFTFKIPAGFSQYVVRVGSIAIDGVSLTIAEITKGAFCVSIIPHTMLNTIFKNYKVGDKVNLEFDIVGKYIEKMIHQNKTTSHPGINLTEKELRESGY